MTDAEDELHAAALDVERAIARWVQARATVEDERKPEEAVRSGQVFMTACVWGVEVASVQRELDGYSLRFVGAPRSQGVSASGGLGHFIARAFR